MPLCIQKLAKPWPAAWDWAISFSWCGNRRSSPPPWMSNSVPRYLVTIAEHSRCQPGRPAPHGEAQLAVVGSPSLWPFQSAKSRGSFLPRGSASGRPLHVIDLLPGQRAVFVPGAHVEVDVAGIVQGGVGVAAVDQLLDQGVHLRDVAGGARLVGGAGDAQGVVGLEEFLLVAVGQRPPFLFADGAGFVLEVRAEGGRGLGEDLVVDVGDVADGGDAEARGTAASG